MPTLLPYFISRNNTFSIRLSFSQEPSGSDQLRYPFVVISETGAFTRILKAEITSDHGSIIKPVFLLMGKDSYLLRGSEQELLNNKDIDQCWQRAYMHFSNDNRLIKLSAQAGDDSRLIQFQPLFFCREKEVFFHPPCPKCGKTLELCTDDDLLNSLGLAPYTKSLRRFLYCADCLQNKRAKDFYTYAPDTADTVIVKDLHHLIEGFGSLKQSEDDGFPCLKCPLQSECYSGNNLAQTRVVPFSFYPFHLFVLESAAINASDFLALISGATFEDIKGRMNSKSQQSRLPYVKSVCDDASQSSPLLFETDARYFLELLYLKLSFLGQLARIVFSNIESLRHPDLALSLDRIWVDLPGKDSLLPYFWNFNATLIDIVQCSMPNPHLPKMPPSYGNYLMGTLWFQTLLSNARHTPEEISAALAEHLHRTDSLNTVVDEKSPMQDHSHLFSPNNIFWNSSERDPDQEWSDLWAEALGLGWALLKSAASGDFRLSENDFRQAFDQLRQQIRESLFMPAQRGAAQTHDLSHDSAIHAILMSILDQWSETPQGMPDEMEQTVIISGQPSQGPAQEGPEETVILKPDLQPLHQTTPPLHPEEDVLETVILSAEDVPAVQPPGIDADIAETVMMKPGRKDLPEPGESMQPDTAPGNMEDDLEATVIMKKDTADETVIMNKYSAEKEMKPHSQQSKAENSAQEEDFLEETVIIRPDKDKE
ncbi:MAG: hypothetical protein JXM72_09460 [Deltaproteobacteria bacterium]|nr:hypothetical protein [Deltaproteobacteria bacterium]